MKKIIIIIGAALLTVLIGISAIWLLPKVQEESIAYNTSVGDLFEKNGHFYVYFYRSECPYCDNIESDIEMLEKTDTVYRVDSEACIGLGKYDWNEHEKKYDVEIGEKDSYGEIVFYDNKSEKDIREEYDPLSYKIVWANEKYVELHSGKKTGKVYAVLTHPKLKETQLKKDNLVLPAIPMLIEFDNHEVKEYYFDDKEIIAHLKSDTKPLDSYWNLD